jgi:hypothetical protein
MIRNLGDEVRNLLIDNKQFLISLAQQLADKGSLKPEEIAQVAIQFGHTFEVQNENYFKIVAYDEYLTAGERKPDTPTAINPFGLS